MLQDDANAKPLDPGLLGEGGEADGGEVIDVLGQLRVEIAQRVVGEGREVDDGVEALEVGYFDRAHVLLDGADGLTPGSEGRTPVQIRVQPHDVVARLEHHRGHDRPDVASTPREQDSHSPSYQMSP